MDEYIHDLLSFNFNGRMNRAKYWKYVLFGFIISIALGVILDQLGLSGTKFSSLINMVFGILCLPFGVRRLHDLDKSGWWYVLFFIPVVNFLFAIYFGFFKGTDGTNSYGPDPLR